MPDFQLQKWYMDIVTNEGHAVIGYYAELAWGKITLNYSGYILRKPEGDVEIKNSFAKSLCPQWNDSDLFWMSNDFEGTWQRMDPGIHVKLLENNSRYIDWNCFMPKGSGKVVANKFEYAGLGYAEKMTLNVVPWKMPFKELFWGRFLSENYSIVWIEWRRGLSKLVIYRNGTLEEQGAISNTSIQTKDWSISFETKHTLRSGSIGKTIFKGMQQLLAVFPSSIFQLNENKWCGKASLSLSNGEKHIGTYIHEHVLWQ